MSLRPTSKLTTCFPARSDAFHAGLESFRQLVNKSVFSFYAAKTGLAKIGNTFCQELIMKKLLCMYEGRSINYGTAKFLGAKVTNKNC